MLGGWLTVREAASCMACSEQQLRDRIREGRIPAQKVGRQWFVPTGGVDDVPRRPVGRPFGERTAWMLIRALEGRDPLVRHREERARLRAYLREPRDVLCQRLRGRARREALSVVESGFARLAADAAFVPGGPAVPPADRGTQTQDLPQAYYVRRSLRERFLDVSLAVPDAREPNAHLLTVADANWPFDADAVAWPLVAWLDAYDLDLVSADDAPAVSVPASLTATTAR